MIGMITKDLNENGYYEQAQKIITMVKSVILSLNTVMLSRMSYLFAQGKMEKMCNNIKKSLGFSLLLGIPMMFGIVGVSRLFVPLFFGKGYAKVVQLLYLCSLLIVITTISNSNW